jgi:hypothetical protein
MARIYVSATYSDLKEHREKVYRVLRQLGHDAVAMQDYVATDQRPLARCLADVEACDLYVGIFAGPCRLAQRSLEAGADVLAWLREDGGDRLLAAMNFATVPMPLRLPAGLPRRAILLLSTDPDRGRRRGLGRLYTRVERGRPPAGLRGRRGGFELALDDVLWARSRCGVKRLLGADHARRHP